MRILFLWILIFGCSINLFAQERPTWFSAIEEAVAKKEASWKIVNKIQDGEGGSWNESLRLESGKNTAAIQVNLMNAHNVRESFDDLVKSFSEKMSRNAVKTELPNFGDKGWIWANIGGSGWTMIYFIKGNVITSIHAPSAHTARRFASHVLNQIPDKANNSNENTVN